MYHEQRIRFYESCSFETLQNAISLLERWKMIERFPHTNETSMFGVVVNESALEALAERVSSFRAPNFSIHGL